MASRFKILPLCFLLAFAVGCLRSDYDLPDPDTLSYSDPSCGTELTKAESTIAYTITSGTPTVALDKCLSVAARAIAMRLCGSDGDISSDEIKEIMLSYGIADAQIGLRTYSAISARKIAGMLKGDLLYELKKGNYTHFGVGVLHKWFPPHACAVIVLTRRVVYLNTFPKKVSQPIDLVLSGRVSQEYPRAFVLLSYPDGKTLTVMVRLNKSGALNVPLPFDQKVPGTYQVEVELLGERGPEVATLFTVDYMGSGQLPAFEIVAVDPGITPGSIEEARRLLLLWLNQERVANRLKPLAEDDRLTALAQKRAVRMLEEGLPRHLDARGHDAAYEAERAGIKFTMLGENLAFDQSIFDAHRGLMQSPSHRANVLHPGYTHVGIGVAMRGKKGSMQVAVAEVFVKR